MTEFYKRLRWYWRRHPMLYYTRYILISRRKRTKLLSEENYNAYNTAKDIPNIFHEVNSEIDLNGDDTLQKAIDISLFLTKKINGGPGLGLASGKALEIMLSDNYGVCSDISQVFNNFCIINKIKVREWGVVERFYGNSYGHSFNEIYDTTIDKWVAIDPSKCLLFYGDDSTPLSAEELFTKARKKERLSYQRFNECIDLKDDYVKKVYFSSKAIPFLLYNYRIKTIDNVLTRFPKVPNFLTSAILILSGRHFRYMMLFNDHKRLWYPKRSYLTDDALETRIKELEQSKQSKLEPYKLSN